MSKGKMGIGRLAIAFAALLTVLAVSGPTRADDDWGRWDQWNNGHHDRDWDDDDGGHHWRHGNNGWGNGGWNNNWRHGNGWGNYWRHDDHYPRYVYVRPRPYYYPQPYYYDYYGRPSFNFIIPLHID